jgi:poly-gamma-glutamate synthesis protein (capsule biosynthesis protein)
LLQEQEGAIDRIDIWKQYIKHRPNGWVAVIRNKLDAKIRPENVNKEWFEKTTYGRYRLRLIEKDIAYLKKNKVDMIIANLHIGGQYNMEPNSYTRKMINWFLKHQCNIVIGNHEHVIHGCIDNREKNQFATYALGNFLGSAGTFHAPYDRRAQYSIAVHTYLDSNSKKIDRITFSVLKAVLTEEGKFQVWPVYDLLSKMKDDEKYQKLIEESLLAAKDFSGIEYGDVAEEFEI